MNPTSNGENPLYQKEVQTYNLNDVYGLFDFKYNSYTNVYYPNQTFYKY